MNDVASVAVNSSTILQLKLDSDEVWYKSVQDSISVKAKWQYAPLTLPIVTKPVNNLLKQSQNVLHQYSGGKSRKENHSLYNHQIKEIVPKDRLLEVCISYYLVYLMQLMFGFGSLMSSRDGVITV